MKMCILMASPRPRGNTASLLAPFTEEATALGAQVEHISLYPKKIAPCIACRTCQDIMNSFGCKQKDDVYPIFSSILAADCFILATPIYSWHCTPPMKALLDRLVYGMNKFYGATRGSALWQGKKCAIITTHGYKFASAADLFEESIKRYCKHSRLQYMGILGARDKGYTTPFITEEKVATARDFARQLMAACAVNGPDAPQPITCLAG